MTEVVTEVAAVRVVRCVVTQAAAFVELWQPASQSSAPSSTASLSSSVEDRMPSSTLTVRAPLWRRVCANEAPCSQRSDESRAQQRWPSRRAVPPLSWPRCVALAAVAERTAMKDPAPRATPTGSTCSRATSSTCCGWAAPSTRSAASTYSLAQRVGTLRARAARCHCTAQAPSLRVAAESVPVEGDLLA
jgi:hypothetical protein